jgi:hypothetical protein
MKQKYSFADLMRTQHNWTPRRWDKEIQLRKAAKKAVYLELGGIIPTFDIFTERDGQKVELVKDAPNYLTANWFNQYVCQFVVGTTSNGQVNPAGSVATGYYSTAANASVFSSNGSYGQLANQQLGTDTSTTSVHRMYKLVSAITHTAPTVSAGSTYSLQSWQGVNADQWSQGSVGLTFAANATSGNPTIGEFGGMAAFATSSSYNICLASRLAAADGVFSSFSMTSSVSLLINWIINFPTP